MLNSKSKLYNVDDAAKLIKSGKILAIHGELHLLKSLPKGNWLGGTIPYFMDITGGIMTEEKLFIEDMSAYVKTITAKMYDANNISAIYVDNKNNSFTYIMIPGLSAVHLKFAQDVYYIKDAFITPTYGWITGFNLGKANDQAWVINGITGECCNDKILATHCDFIDKSWQLHIDMVNIFDALPTNKIHFETSGFEVETAIIDGKKCNFNKYLKDNNINIQNPLAANYAGSLINISFKGMENNKVQFYAPVFAEAEYKFTTLNSEYHTAYNDTIAANVAALQDKFLSCSCILHYLYGKLNGKTIQNSDGPFTFGEIAYVLLNQTLVYTRVVGASVMTE